MLHSAEEFKKTISNFLDDFSCNGPFSDSTSTAAAMDFIAHMRTEVTRLKMNEDDIRRGLTIFKIDQPPSHLIANMERVICYINTYLKPYLK